MSLSSGAAVLLVLLWDGDGDVDGATIILEMNRSLRLPSHVFTSKSSCFTSEAGRKVLTEDVPQESAPQGGWNHLCSVKGSRGVLQRSAAAWRTPVVVSLIRGGLVLLDL